LIEEKKSAAPVVNSQPVTKVVPNLPALADAPLTVSKSMQVKP